MTYKLNRRIQANVALTLLLVVSAFLLLGGIALIGSTIDTSLSAKAYNSSKIAQLRVDSCVEESLYRIKNNSAYTGTFTVTFNSTDNCNITVTTTSATVKGLSITSTVGIYSYKTTKSVDMSTSPYTVM